MTLFTRIKWKAVNIVLKFYDPVVAVWEGRSKLRMRLSHTTAFCYARHPMYDKALPRIAKSIQNREGKLICIDVGANIGDTAALIAQAVDGASILCVEGNEKILDFLEYNTGLIKNNSISIEPRFCVDSAVNVNYTVDMHYGTASLIKSNEASIQADTLDNMIQHHPVFLGTNLLKIDTDGFEITVLNGSKDLLSKQPAIYFEFNPFDYQKMGQSPFDLIDLLVSYGYKKALFYTNFGLPIGVFDITNKSIVQELIDKIDNKLIYYYDILVISESKYNSHKSIFEAELSCQI